MDNQVKDLQVILATLPDIEDVKAGLVTLTPDQFVAIERASEICSKIAAEIVPVVLAWAEAFNKVVLQVSHDICVWAKSVGLINDLPQLPLLVKERHSRREKRRRHSKRVKGR